MSNKRTFRRRKIIIERPVKQINLIKNIIRKNKKEFEKRNVDIKYVTKPIFKGKLIGYDGYLKKSIKNPEDISGFIKEIDNMPMGSIEKIINKWGGKSDKKTRKNRKNLN